MTAANGYALYGNAHCTYLVSLAKQPDLNNEMIFPQRLQFQRAHKKRKEINKYVPTAGTKHKNKWHDITILSSLRRQNLRYKIIIIESLLVRRGYRWVSYIRESWSPRLIRLSLCDGRWHEDGVFIGKTIIFWSENLNNLKSIGDTYHHLYHQIN